MHPDREMKVELFLKASLGLWLASILALGVTAMARVMLGFDMSSWPVVAGALALVVAPWLLLRINLSGVGRRRERRLWLTGVIGGNLLLLAVLMLVNSVVWDMSWDGQYEHQRVATLLARDIRPSSVLTREEIAERIREDFPAYATHLETSVSGVSGYQLYALRGLGQLIHAVTLYATGWIEVAKAYNGILIWVSFCALALGFRAVGLDLRRAALLALLGALNPISVPQLFSSSLDAQVASLGACVLGVGLLFLRRPSREHLALFVFAAGLLSVSKVTGPLLAASLAGGIFCWYLLAAKRWRMWVRYLGVRRVALIVGSVAVLGLVSFSVMVLPRLIERDASGKVSFESVLEHVTDFLGYKASNIVSFDRSNRVDSFYLSLINQTTHAHDQMYPKIPGEIHLRELKIYTKLYEAPELGGFGPFFSLALLTAFVVFIALLVHRPRPGRLLPALVIFLLLMSMLMPSSYLARLVPLFWFVPILVLMLGWIQGVRGWVGWARRFLLTILVLNVSLVALLHLYGQFHVQKAYRNQLALLAEVDEPMEIDFGNFAPVERRLREYGIHYIPVDEVESSGLRCVQLLRTSAESGVRIGVSAEETEVLYELENLEDRLHERYIPLSLFSKR